MRTSRTVASVALLLVAASVADAQLHGPALWPIVDDDLASLIVGEFSGDTHVDAVVLANGKPVLRATVESSQTYVWADVTAIDIATLPGGGAGGRDRVVAVGPAGLSLLELQDPPDSPPWSVVTLRDAGTHWASAVAVRVGQVDGLHGADVVAVTPTRVVIARSDGLGGWMSDVFFMAGTGIDGLELVDWDGAADGALEIAVLMTATPTLPARIRLMRSTGTALAILYSNSDRIVAAPLAAAGIGTRYLAAVGTDDVTGAQELVFLASDDLGGPWSLGVAGVHDMAGGDWTGDGIDDLVLGTTAARDAQLCVVVADGPAQLALDPLHTPPDPPLSLPVGHPQRNPAVQDGGMALADVDHDGDLDLVTAVQGEYAGSSYEYLDPRFSAVECTLNGTVNERDWLPWHAPGSVWPAGLEPPEHHLLAGTITVPLVTPTEVLSGAQFEYAVWHTPSIEALSDPTPIVGPSSAAIGAESNGLGLAWTTLTLPLGQHDHWFPDRYTLVVRQVVREAGGAIVQQSPALMVTFYSALDLEVYASAWNVTTNGPLPLDGPEPGDSGGHSSGAPPPPPPPVPSGP